jgi:hypothetical protein
VATHKLNKQIGRFSQRVPGLRKQDLTRVLSLKDRQRDGWIQNGYGRCEQCSCPGFLGSGYTCTRGGCDHHYDEHG